MYLVDAIVYGCILDVLLGIRVLLKTVVQSMAIYLSTDFKKFPNKCTRRSVVFSVKSFETSIFVIKN